MNGKKQIRRQYLVDRAYQMRFVGHLFTAILAVAVIGSLISSVILWSNLEASSDTSTSLAVSLIAVAITLLFQLVVGGGLVYYIGIRQSHRIVGPMIRIKRALEAIGAGDFTQRIQLRKDDALQDLAEAINKMAENLQQRFPRSPAS